jgi:pSer/pThr/pTyr-binding forkhead associated (FHA) protein
MARVKGATMNDSTEPAETGLASDVQALAAQSAEMLPLEIMVLDHYARKSRCLLRSLPARFGRDEKDDVRLGDPWISHSHCEIFQHGGSLMVRDLDSKNGVFLHGVRIREGEIHPGDCFTLGRTEVTVLFGRTSGVGSRACDQAAPNSPSSGRPVEGVPGKGGPVTEELLY